MVVMGRRRIRMVPRRATAAMRRRSSGGTGRHFGVVLMISSRRRIAAAAAARGLRRLRGESLAFCRCHDSVLVCIDIVLVDSVLLDLERNKALLGDWRLLVFVRLEALERRINRLYFFCSFF